MPYDKAVEHKTICPHCGKPSDMCETEGGGTPAPGDVSMCIGCGQFSKFDDDLNLRQFTNEEKLDLVQDEEAMHDMQRIKTAWLMSVACMNIAKG